MHTDVGRSGERAKERRDETDDGSEKADRMSRRVWSGEWRNSNLKPQSSSANQITGKLRTRGKSSGKSRREWYRRRNQYQYLDKGRNVGKGVNKNYYWNGDKYRGSERQVRAPGGPRGGRKWTNGRQEYRTGKAARNIHLHFQL
ncbi:uncharacterized protein LOC122505842 [Leptopilina heterotoma]|uniref:uncharacterized protein LOC122505842 n=1 Tax=Leptopilina heterotoma TaxID=63436 RepID=UPI001CA81B1A|nr:uncharacterized protein LOC122505842 [Leptopilina heterotoma]